MDTQEHSACTALKELQSQVLDREKVVDENLVQLQTQILNATTETTLGQQALQLKLDTQATNLATEVSERQASQQLLQANISGVQTAIQTEVSNRQEAITGIRSELTTLQTSVPLTVQAAIDNLVAGAPKALDTLKEISDWIESHDGETGIVTELNAAIAQAEANAKNLANATGVLAIDKGGTGETTGTKACNSLLKSLETGASTPIDTDTFISQYAGGSSSGETSADRNNYYKRPVSALWEYLKGKISSVLGLTSTSYGGKAATAGTADTAKACSGNAATATTASSCSGNAATATQATGATPFNAAQQVVTAGTVTRAIAQNVLKSGNGYISRIALGLTNKTSQFSDGIISLGSNDEGTSWEDFTLKKGTGGQIITSATVDVALSTSSTNPVQNKVVNTALGNKVDKVSGKGLSTNDFTADYKSKLDSITIV